MESWKIKARVGQNGDRTCSEKEFYMNMEAQYESDAELDDASRKQNEAAAVDRLSTRESNVETTSRNPSTSERWGSSFLKDYQPMSPQNGSESGGDSKSGSDYRNEDESEDNSSEGRREKIWLRR